MRLINIHEPEFSYDDTDTTANSSTVPSSSCASSWKG